MDLFTGATATSQASTREITDICLQRCAYSFRFICEEETQLSSLAATVARDSEFAAALALFRRSGAAASAPATHT
jgi:hypothetical protein